MPNLKVITLCEFIPKLFFNAIIFHLIWNFIANGSVLIAYTKPVFRCKS